MDFSGAVRQESLLETRAWRRGQPFAQATSGKPSFGLKRSRRILLQKLRATLDFHFHPDFIPSALSPWEAGQYLGLQWQGIWQQEKTGLVWGHCGTSGSWHTKLECCHVWPVHRHPLSTLTQRLCLPYPEEWSKHWPNDDFICSSIFQRQTIKRA